MRYSTALLPAVITTGTINFLNAKATLCTELHWLNVPERVVYKLCIMVYSCLHGQAPQYLVDLCLGYQSPTSLLGSISGRPVDDTWSFHDTSCERTADGLSLLLARRPGTHCLTI